VPIEVQHAIVAGDRDLLQRRVLDVAAADAEMAAWLADPRVGEWLSRYVQRLHRFLVARAETEPDPRSAVDDPVV
jgi:hypothetical protein